ncbi:MAG: hypothetical protein ACOVQT_05390 [Rubrivivax sp.]|jgi:hypothetical protein
MPETIRVAILRGRVTNPRPDGAAPLPPLPTDAGVLGVLVHNALRTAVFDYWEEVTDGNLQFEGHVMFPWVDVAFDASDIDFDGSAMVSRLSGNSQREKIKAAVRALPGGPAHFDDFRVLIVLSFPGDAIVNPAFGQIGQDPRHTPVALYDGGNRGGVIAPYLPTTHSFLCHELGHSLGLKDAHGILANPGLPTTGNYANPYDIMGAEGWGGSSPCYAGAAFPGWPNPTLASRMGPAPSLAVLHHLNRDHVRASDVKSIVVTDDTTPAFHLFAAHGKRGRTRLIAVRHPLESEDGFARVYLEYRDIHGWDQGLDAAGPDLARRALVVHVVIPAPVTDPPTMQACYRARLLIPREVDSDLEIPHSPYTVRVLEENVEDRFIVVKVNRTAQAGLELLSERVEREGALAGLGGEETTPCGDLLRWGVYATLTRLALRPIAFGQGGIGGPGYRPGPGAVVKWEIGGRELQVNAGAGSHFVLFNGNPIRLQVQLEPATQTLQMEAPEGIACTAEVKCTVTDPVAGPVLTARTDYVARGTVRRLPPEDVVKLARCELGFLKQVYKERNKPGFPRGENPFELWRSGPGRERILDFVGSRGTPRLRDSLAALKELAALRKGLQG